MIRGLVIDKEKGNLVKADRFGYVQRAMHGTRMLSNRAVRYLLNLISTLICGARQSEIPNGGIDRTLLILVDMQSTPFVHSYDFVKSHEKKVHVAFV